MYTTQKNQIRNLTAKEFEALRMLCRLTKNLYNVGLYTVRQYFFTERKHLKNAKKSQFRYTFRNLTNQNLELNSPGVG
jgi:hypothetical protein